ncbi:hypothetical protein D3C75_849020 [compost metagenome]
MTGDYISQKQRHLLTRPLLSYGLRSGSGMINIEGGAFQPSLEFRRVFSQVVQQASCMPPLLRAKPGSKISRLFRHFSQMINETLPILLILTIRTMSIIDHISRPLLCN